MVLHAVRLISNPTVEKFRRGSGLCPMNRERAGCPRGHASHARVAGSPWADYAAARDNPNLCYRNSPLPGSLET